MTTKDSHPDGNASLWASRLEAGDPPLPAGFAFFTMRKIMLERLRRAELSARWQAASLAVVSSILVIACLTLLTLFGFNQLSWLGSIPWVELIVTLTIVVSFLVLDTLLDRRFGNSAG